MMRLQQSIAFNGSEGYLPAYHYDQVFTAHGVIMIFFVATPLVLGLMNVIVPLQIGARDVAFPFVNSLSFWLSAMGSVLVMLSMFVGDFAATGWVAYPPLSELGYSPTPGVDYYIWSLQISGLGTTLTGINFIVTILRMRAPTMGLMKMPVFTWTALITNILILAIFPVLTATLVLLSLDRLFREDAEDGTLDLLVHLVTHPGMLLTKQALLDAIWGSVVVTENSLTQCIHQLRTALGDVLRVTQPDCVVSTYPAYAPVIRELFRDHAEKPFRLVTIVTDSLSVNAAWYRAPSDAFVVNPPAIAITSDNRVRSFVIGYVPG